MPASRPHRTPAVWFLMLLLLIQALGGIAGGASLSIRPDGSIMKMPLSYLSGSPFSDYLIPGICLLLILGILPLVVLVGVWRADTWAWYGAFTVGCGLIIFEIVEFSVIGYNWMQVLFGGIGVFITIVSLLPSVRHYHRMYVLDRRAAE
jgi:hypothetical protein